MVLESVRAGPVAAAKPGTGGGVRGGGAEVIPLRGEAAERPDADPLLHEDEDEDGSAGAQSAFPFVRPATPGAGVPSTDAGEAGAGHVVQSVPVRHIFASWDLATIVIPNRCCTVIKGIPLFEKFAKLRLRHPPRKRFVHKPYP